MIDQNPDKKRPGMGFIEMWHAFLLDFCKNWQNRFHKLVKSCHQASPDKMHVRKEQKRNKVYTKSGMLQMTFKSCGHYCYQRCLYTYHRQSKTRPIVVDPCA